MDHIQRLQGLYDIVDLSKARHCSISQLTSQLPSTESAPSKPVLVISRGSLGELARVVQELTHPHVLVVVPLSPGEGVPSRVACSGWVHSEAVTTIKDAGYYYLGSDTMAAGTFSVLERALCAIQTTLAAEAVSLGVKAGLNPQLLYAAIAGATGSSWSFRNLAPVMLSIHPADPTNEFHSLHTALKALMEESRIAGKESFYSPLSALALQLLQTAAGVEDQAELSSLCPNVLTNGTAPTFNSHAVAPVVTPIRPSQVAFIGLGAMGFGMANVLRNGGHNVVGYDAWKPSMDRYAAGGGVCSLAPDGCAENAEVLVLMVVNASQAQQVLFQQGVAQALPRYAVVLLMSTVSPSQAVTLADSLRQVRPDLCFVDAPVSGGTPRAATGDLTILCAGLDASTVGSAKALSVFEALSLSRGNRENLILVPGGPGMGAAVKLVNQHLAGCHISSTAEALAFATRVGLPLRLTRAALLSGPAQSWMMGHRGKHMLDGLLQPPTSMIDIFVKDMCIVVDEAARLGCPVPLASHVRQQFLLGKSCGWGQDDDSSLVRLWRISGIDVTCPP